VGVRGVFQSLRREEEEEEEEEEGFVCTLPQNDTSNSVRHHEGRLAIPPWGEWLVGVWLIKDLWPTKGNQGGGDEEISSNSSSGGGIEEVVGALNRLSHLQSIYSPPY